MHDSPPNPFVARNTTPSTDPEQFLQLRIDSIAPTNSSPFSSVPLYSHSSRDLPTPYFAHPSSSSFTRTVGNADKHFSRAPLNHASSTVSPLDSDRQLLWTRNHDGVISSGSRYSPGPLNSFKLSASSDLRGSTHKDSLVHQRNGDVKSRSVIRHPTSRQRDDVIPEHLGRVDLPPDHEEGLLGCETRVTSVGSSQLDLRRQRIVESEQRRRNDLRGGFARLKDALPASHEKCSKLVLLDRAATYIGHLEAMLRDKHGEIGGAQADRCARLA
ncbi:hypothetical protein FRC12_006438 [Ceratobasidium sp. 428]|nr:hypothetical protein FRC12_006438 [Ceratobasidium sp. 428]